MLSRITILLVACFVLLTVTMLVFSVNYWFFGLLAGAFVWFAWDLWLGTRLTAFLQAAQLSPDVSQWKMPVFAGQWGEAFERMQRLLRDKDRALVGEKNRHAAFLQAIQNSPNGVVLLDKERRIEWCNQTAAQHLGLDAQRDIAQHIGNLVRDPVFTAYLQSAKPGEEIVVSGMLHSLKRPVRISVQLHAYAQPSDTSGFNNSSGGALLLSRDVTALEQNDAMRRDFVANVSHEIRTPLTVLSGFVETLQTLPLDAAQRSRYLGLMAQQSQRMQALVSDLLTLSKLEGSPMPSIDTGVAVHALLSRVESDARALLGLQENPQRLRFEEVYEGDGSYRILGVESELQSAMQNLVSNALRYTPPLGVVLVRWQVLPDGRGQFTVTDTGPGIAPEHIARLTERFYRVDRSRSRESGGTGLGLSIVKHVVQRHGGELHIESALGHGSSFWFTLPAARISLV